MKETKEANERQGKTGTGHVVKRVEYRDPCQMVRQVANQEEKNQGKTLRRQSASLAAAKQGNGRLQAGWLVAMQARTDQKVRTTTAQRQAWLGQRRGAKINSQGPGKTGERGGVRHMGRVRGCKTAGVSGQ